MFKCVHLTHLHEYTSDKTVCKKKRAKTENPQLHIPNFVSVKLVTTKMQSYFI